MEGGRMSVEHVEPRVRQLFASYVAAYVNTKTLLRNEVAQGNRRGPTYQHLLNRVCDWYREQFQVSELEWNMVASRAVTAAVQQCIEEYLQ
jgi:hypothetical protein